MRILMIGGTRFLGRYIVAEALERGHHVTLFHRGHTGVELFPQVERIFGDRETDMERLGNRTWDAVVDTCGFMPWSVRPAVSYLKDRVEQYVFISSQSVYADWTRIGLDEASPVATLPPEKVEELRESGAGPYGDHYGAMKALCERLIDEEMPGHALHVRAGLIVGPHDYSDRFTWWVVRAAQGGDMLVPGSPERLVQWIDVRDLAAWILRMIEKRVSGVFNVTGPEEPLTMRQVIDACVEAGECKATPIWTDEAFLLEKGVKPWTELPLWLPEHVGLTPGEKPPIGFFRVSNQKALSHGLTFRSALETAQDTLAWWKRESPRELQCGISREKERRLLDEWKKRN
jgi:2'-hydroxyisoflavone reductase